MDIVISRILKYLNGCLDNDHMYKIGLFIVRNYVEMEDYDLQRLMSFSLFLRSPHMPDKQVLPASAYLLRLHMDNHPRFDVC